jgi:hypothetical protein
MIHIQCQDIILRERYSDPNLIPPPLETLIGLFRNFHLKIQTTRQGAHTKFTCNNAPESTSEPSHTQPTIFTPLKISESSTKRPATTDEGKRYSENDLIKNIYFLGLEILTLPITGDNKRKSKKKQS